MTNGAAIGYMKLAAKRLSMNDGRFTPELIERLEQAMYEEMKFKSEEEAEEAYLSS